MKRELFLSHLKKLSSEAVNNDLQIADVKTIFTHCARELLLNNQPCISRKGSKDNQNRKRCKYIRTPPFSVWLIPLFILFSGILAVAFAKFVEYQFQFTFLTKALSEEQCFVDNMEILTEITRPLVDCSRCKDIFSVPQLTDVTQNEFLDKYAYTNVPLLMKGAAKEWPAVQKYNFGYFQSLYHSRPGSIDEIEKNCQFFNYKTNFLELGEVFNMSDARANLKEGEETWYIGWCDINTETAKELRKQYVRPSYLPIPAVENDHLYEADWIFMGWPGEGANRHIDLVSAPSWQAQLSGKKTWLLFPSVECEDLCRPLNVTLEPGDILTVDTNKWFHATFIHPGNISISVGSEY